MTNKKNTKHMNSHDSLIGKDSMKKANSPTIGIVGLGYVGLPVAIGFADKYNVIGFDVNKSKIDSFKKHVDTTGEFSSTELKEASINFTTEERRLSECSYIIVAVPTPITLTKEPDLTYLESASTIIGKNLTSDTIIVYESTVYPGTTEEICIPILEAYSNLTAGIDFHVGYSPERINPGDKEHTFKSNNKVISAQNDHALEKMCEVYRNVLSAEIYKAPSIKVAEASKIIENTQRDVNIALMNELSLIFDKLDIDTHEVIHAANTKWNFFPFTPGLVGGHCIGIDPYYLIYKSKLEGYNPAFLSSARAINDYIPEYVVQSLLNLIIAHKLNLQDIRITVLGITFKEDISDIRNSKSIEIVDKLQQLGLSVQVCDPHVSREQLDEKSNIGLTEINQLKKANIVIFAVPHKEFKDQDDEFLNDLLKANQGIMMDLKGIIPRDILHQDTLLWRL